MIHDYEVHEVVQGWLVMGARLESEARQAVLEDLIDRLGGDIYEMGSGVLDLSDAEAEPGYWELEEDGDEVRFARSLNELEEPAHDDFGFLLRLEVEDADGED